MKNAIVGYTGFVGSNLLQFYKFDEFYNSKNFTDASGKKFDKMFFCGVPAVKWKSNKFPDLDDKVFINLKSILDNIEVNKFILISTIDVYDETDKNHDEDTTINCEKNHTYGKNRFLFEQYILNKFKDSHIVRLPALFGKGLKKNIIYDLINNNNVYDIPLHSSFQWYYLNWLKEDIDKIIENDIKICNLFTEPIHTHKIIDMYTEIFENDYEFEYGEKDKITRKYDTNTKYNKIFNCEKKYAKTKNEVFEGIKDYLKFEKLDKKNLCISNICINNISQFQFACILKLFGISKIQIAPTKIINNWDELNKINFDIFKSNNIEIYSFQSITYTLNDLNIFTNTNDKLLNHLKNVIDCAEKNNIKILVFGCPRNRKIINNDVNNFEIFCNFFKKLGDYCVNKKVVICIENNSKKYNCNFINNINECSFVVRRINKKNIKMMVDLGNCKMENDNLEFIKNNIDIIYNIDVSQEFMNDFSEIDESNYKFIEILKKCNYNKVKNLEMLIKNDNELDTLNKSLNNFIKLYSTEKKKKKNICVIGAGWYGLHISKYIENNYSNRYNLKILEKDKLFFNNSSNYNQNRLHLGYHYPRSLTTRKLCLNGYKKFINEYRHLIDFIDNNYYLISEESLIDYGTYKKIFSDNEKYDHTLIKNNYFDKIQGDIINTKEKIINSEKVKKYFKNHKIYNLINFDFEVKTIKKLKNKISINNKISCDILLDCTYNHLNLFNEKNIYELTISLIYNRINFDENFESITVMDGEFFSLFPREISKKKYTLTHVKYTPLIKTYNVNDLKDFSLEKEKLNEIIENMEKETIKVYKNFKKNFEYDSYFISYKCKLDSKSDSRECDIKINNNILSVNCGKITGIFEFENSIKSFLEEINN